jgi:hypothetical protein
MQRDEAREFAQELVKLLGVDDALIVVDYISEILGAAICEKCPNGIERLPAICRVCPNSISGMSQH